MGLIGRDADVASIVAFQAAAIGAPAALVIMGEAGIGKTSVWRHLLDSVGSSARVLSCQPTPAERPLAFSALDDLFGDVAREQILSALAEGRRNAVQAALSTGLAPVGPAGRTLPDRRLVARGILEAIQLIADSKPLLIAVDDAQWLDRPSAGVLEFCFRRLRDEPLFILLTCRSSGPALLGLDRALPPDRLGRVQLGPLTLAAIGEILRARLGTVLPRYALTRLYDTCGGNPFYALECGRALLDQPHMSLPRQPIPLPPSLDSLVQHRLGRLPADVRCVGRLIAASSDPRERLIRAACDDGESWAPIDLAVEEGIIERDGDVLRFTHPLLQSVLYTEMPMAERRQAHQRLAAVAVDIEDRAWHIALGADRPSEDIAGLLESAARHAASRGAPDEAAALTEQAVRLTPVTLPNTARKRQVQAADYHFRAGSMARSQELIESALAASPAGLPRASLLVRLATIHYHLSGWPLAEQTFRLAQTEAPEDPALRAHAEQELAFARVVAGDLPAALDLAKASLRSAERADDRRLMAHSLARIAAFEFMHGDGARFDLLDQAEALSASSVDEPTGRMALHSPLLVKGLLLKWTDRLDEARAVLAADYRNALDRGDEASLPFLLYNFSELECWAGNLDTAGEYALEGCRVAEESGQRTMRPAILYCLALVHAYRGHLAQTRELASEALALCKQTGNIPVAHQVTSALGFAELSAGNHQAAMSHLDRLAEATAAFGLGEPGVVRFVPDTIEALAATGEIERAWSLTQQLEERGNSLDRPWAQATASRCQAQLAALDGDLHRAHAACEGALIYHARVSMPLDLARTLLIKGMIERRGRRKSAAQVTLGQALRIFEKLGAPLWAEKARRELSKIAVRASQGGLTETERRVADLIAQGQTNRQIAATMFVTENTVQSHVQHIFQKIGVRSRTELAAQFHSTSATASTVENSSAT